MLSFKPSSILVLIVCIISLIKGIQSIQHYLNYTIPEQLLQLVKQAHFGKEYQTIWDIEVSTEMRIALLAPLSAQQLQLFSQLKDDTISTSINGYVLSHKLKSKELSGIVCVSVDVHSRSGLYDYSYPKTKLRITVCHAGRPGVDNKWFVSSVEKV